MPRGYGPVRTPIEAHDEDSGTRLLQTGVGKGISMLSWSVIFLIVTLIAAALGFSKGLACTQPRLGEAMYLGSALEAFRGSRSRGDGRIGGMASMVATMAQ